MSLSRSLPLWVVAMSVAVGVGEVHAQRPGFDPNQSGQVADRRIPALEGVGIEERLEAQVPHGMEFVDAEGQTVRLGDLFDGERPVVLTLNYASCPQLCGLQLDGFVRTLEGMEDWTPGNQFRIVTVSLDPTETAQRSREFRDALLQGYGRAEVAKVGWSFLRGTEEDIRHLADLVGFRYNYDEASGDYAHAAALILLDPKGRVTRYLYGIDFLPETLRLSLAETADSKFVSTLDALILRCFLYDASTGTFVASAWNITRFVLSFFALFLFAFIVWLVRMERKTRQSKAA